MKTALVTGSAGFVGRHMVRELEARGYDVDRIDIGHGDKESRHILATGMEDERGFEYRTSDALLAFTAVQKVYDLVVHCAYHVGGRAAIDGTNTHFMKNVQLDGAMFEWAVRTKQKRVLYFSSSAAYPLGWQIEAPPEGEDFRLSEEFVCTPNTADTRYGYAKVVGERLAHDARSNGVPVTVVRPFSGYGADQSLDYPFPSIVRRASQGVLAVWGPPGQCRDWIHISDVVRGALAVAESGTTEPVNLCTGRATEMGDLMHMVRKQVWLNYGDWSPVKSWNPEANPITYLTDKPTGVFYRVGDPTRMLQYYTPQISLEEGIQEALSEMEG